MNLHIQQKKFWEDKRRSKRRCPNHPVVRAFVSPKINFILENLKLSKKATLLDVGCGNGFFTYHLGKLCNVTGLDFSEQMLKINPHPRLVNGDAKNLPFNNNSFDIVFCSNLLHHLENPEITIREMKRVAKNYVILSEPNRNNPLMFLFGLIKKEERKSLNFTKRYLNKICKNINLQPIKALLSGFIYPNKTSDNKILLSFLKKLDFNNPLGSYVTIIYKKQ